MIKKTHVGIRTHKKVLLEMAKLNDNFNLAKHRLSASLMNASELQNWNDRLESTVQLMRARIVSLESSLKTANTNIKEVNEINSALGAPSVSVAFRLLRGALRSAIRKYLGV